MTKIKKIKMEIIRYNDEGEETFREEFKNYIEATKFLGAMEAEETAEFEEEF